MEQKTQRIVEIYTDGSCSGNPGVGAWAAILVYGSHEKELTGAEEMTTNNRMELTAVIRALEALNRPMSCAVYSDSAYVLGGYCSGWVESWKRKNWLNSAKNPVANQDLWRRLDELVSKHQVSWHKVKGHSGHAYNERCDQLAVSSCKTLAQQLQERRL